MTTKETVNLEELETLYKGKIDFFTKKLEAIQILKQPEDSECPEVPIVPIHNKNTKEFHLDNTYNPNFSQKEKVYYALREIGSGFAIDVIRKLEELDKSIPLNRIAKLVIGNLSVLNRDGFIKHEALSARKFKYYI